MNKEPAAHRGRPKTLDRDQILQTALMEYWSKGASNVSINEICKKTGASKPSVYREFQSDDGLKSSVLETYQHLAVQPLIDILDKEQPASETIESVINFMTQDRSLLGIPDGCLFVMMRAQSQQLGQCTLQRLDLVRRDLWAAYRAWIVRGKQRGEIVDNPTNTLVLYLDVQHGGAMRMQKEGVGNDVIAEVLRFALKGALLDNSTVTH